MGSGASKSNSETSSVTSPCRGTSVAVHFHHGCPTVPYEEAIGCFKAVGYSNKVTKDGAVRTVTTTSQPGYLYRLVNRKTRQWHFYNDTTTFTFTVRGYFGANNAIRPLGRAKMFREMPSELIIVELTVGPLETLPYIEGDVHDGFDINFTAIPRKQETSTRSGLYRPGTLVASTVRVPVASVDSDGLSHTSSAMRIRPTSSTGTATLSHDHNALAYCPNCHATTLLTTSVPCSVATATSLALPSCPRSILRESQEQRSPSSNNVNPADQFGATQLTLSSTAHANLKASKSSSNGRDSSNDRRALDNSPHDKKQTAQPGVFLIDDSPNPHSDLIM